MYFTLDFNYKSNVFYQFSLQMLYEKKNKNILIKWYNIFLTQGSTSSMSIKLSLNHAENHVCVFSFLLYTRNNIGRFCGLRFTGNLFRTSCPFISACQSTFFRLKHSAFFRLRIGNWTKTLNVDG